MREVYGAPRAEMPQVEEESEDACQHEDRGESMRWEGSAVAKLSDRFRRSEEENVLNEEARLELCENCKSGRIVWQEII